VSTSTLVQAPVSLPKLTARDRCDSCGAQAFMRFIVPETPARMEQRAALQIPDDAKIELPGELTFCGHHGAEYEATIGSLGAVVQDETDNINAKPSVSANAV
jgi:hypothetical protein